MGMANRLDDKDTEGHNGLPIQRRLAAEKERADYAWRNVRAIDAHRMAKEAEATAHIERQRAEIALLRHHLTELAKVADRAAMVLTTVRLMPCLDRLATFHVTGRRQTRTRLTTVRVDVVVGRNRNYEERKERTMSHHGSNPFGDEEKRGKTSELMRKLLAEATMTGDPLRDMQRKLQGEYPDGRLNTGDEGALAVMIGHENGKVVMQFPSPTAWIGFTPEQAMDIAQTLITHARKAGIVGVYTLQL